MSYTPPNYLVGRLLSATIGSAGATIQKSNIKCSTNKINVTNKKSNGFQELGQGIRSASGTATLVYDADLGAGITINDGDVLDVTIGVTGGRVFAGKMMVSDVTDDASIEGEYTVSVTLDSTGPFTITTS